MELTATIRATEMVLVVSCHDLTLYCTSKSFQPRALNNVEAIPNSKSTSVGWFFETQDST